MKNRKGEKYEYQVAEFAYGLPVLPLYFLFGPIAILQGIYAKYFGLSLTTIAAVLFIARLFDAVSDPIVGYGVDRYYARYRTRKPFVVVGGAMFAFSSWFLYAPPSNVSSAYFLIWFLAFYLSYTIFEIPHLAWGGDLAGNSYEKNRIYAIRSFYLFTGMLLFFAIPLLPIFETNEFTPQTLKWSVLAAGVLMIPALYINVVIAPDQNMARPSTTPEGGLGTQDSLRELFRTTLANKPLLILTAAHICTGVAAGLWMTLLFIFVDAYLLLGEFFALAYVASFGFSIAALWFWYRVADRWGKQAAWAIGMTFVALGMAMTGFLSPSKTGWMSLGLSMTLIFGGFAAFNCMVPSIMSDIVDYGSWKFGQDRNATYFSLYTFINKAAGALGGALGLAIVGWHGFLPTATSHDENAVDGIRLAVAWIPLLLITLSIVLITQIPITSRQHSIIRRRLDARLARAARGINSYPNQAQRSRNDHTTKTI